MLFAAAPCALLTPCPAAGAATGEPSPARSAAARPRVTRVVIKKREHTMQLMTRATGAAGDEEVVATYKVAIGPGGLGPKTREGDMVTPVGRYHVTARHPSKYRIFLGLDYPNADDRRRFTALKKSGALPPSATIGGAIGIHGPPVSTPAPLKSAMKQVDWTAGCIAVDDDEIVEIASLVRDGTPVDIED